MVKIVRYLVFFQRFYFSPAMPPEGLECDDVPCSYIRWSGLIQTPVWICRCDLRWSLVCHRWGTHPADRSFTEGTHQVSECLTHQTFTPAYFYWLTEVCAWCHLLLGFQWFPNATMTMWWRSTSREAWDWTTRRLAPSSPSVSLLMTTLLRLWGTNGCRLNPNPPPVLPHLPAARVLHTPQHTATVKPSATRRPPAAHRQTAATGLTIKSGRNKENVDFVTVIISLQSCVLSSLKKKKQQKKVVQALRGWSWQRQWGCGPARVGILKMHWCSDM